MKSENEINVGVKTLLEELGQCEIKALCESRRVQL